jgi:glycosyltransferase involved in cell wall biosynthesis
VLYLHGRPGPHPLHGRLAKAVGADSQYIDFRLRWQDRDRGRLYTMASWFVCAATLPGRRNYDVFLVDNLHISPVIMKLLFLRRRQKIVVHLGSHTLYFLYTHRFSRSVERLHLWALKRYDALLCEGAMAAELAHRLLPGSCPPTYETFIGPPAERAEALGVSEPSLEGRKILCIASGPDEARMHYKGIDLMVDAVAAAAERDPAIELDILGKWDPAIVDACLSRVSEDARSHIHFRGESRDVADWLQQASLYLQCTRGDAFPTSTLEAMTAGLPPIVSEWTGTRQIVREVDSRLIVPLEAAEIAERIHWYFGLDPEERAQLSQRCREAVAGYTQEAAIEHYRETFASLCGDLGVPA